MGVKGFTRILQDVGWLPDDGLCCSTSLWRHESVMHKCPKFADKVSLVSRRSTFLIDGSGLAFHLYKIAYARHISRVIADTTENSNVRRRSSMSACPCAATKHMKPEQVNQLLPNLLPLTVLEDVTRDFVDFLTKKHHIKLVVYFDGDLRREAKKETNLKRQKRRPMEWSALQQYCCNGIMPSVDRVCQWEECFPKNRLFLAQIKHTLSLRGVEILKCTEEADAELARQASKTPNSYVVGNDSDFCFFPNCKYIPLKTLHATASVVTASVITRKELAESLRLPSEESLVELAILLGNDYVKLSPNDKVNLDHNNANNILQYLRSQKNASFRVTSTCGGETEKAIRFARSFYNLEDLDLIKASPLVSPPKDIDARIEEPGVDDGYFDDLTMRMPANYPVELTLIQPRDVSITGAIVRSLEAYLERRKDDGDATNINQLHIEALKQMPTRKQRIDNTMPSWRPLWEDVHPCYVIECCIAYTIRRSSSSPMVKLSSLGKVFDAYSFHQTLYKLRNPSIARNPKQLQRQITDSSRRSTSSRQRNDGSESPRQRLKQKNKLRQVLPIDEHEETIISAISQNRVTVIQAETGAGKSSRVPVMIMNAPLPDPALNEVQIFIAQPRRIAAKALVERLRDTEPDHGKHIALRMGHGVREYETSATKAWFVTTGYLVRLLANHPERFDKVTHLIIDEIHERSVDTDVLCLLCRRLLVSNKHIRLVLMSATLAASLLCQYFSAKPPIRVGAKRYPIQEVFVEDLPSVFRLAPKEIKAVRQVEGECRKTLCVAPPSDSGMDSIYNLAARVAISVGKPGSSVLIFVPGMRDIESISEIIEKTYVPGINFVCIPVHSDIPFEDQMAVFDEVHEEVKIIIATNAAESSITLPDCDHVICTGLQKQIIYNAASHRQMLLPCWISRASALQRAGRVGRVRPGTVFRLYTREAYESFMTEFESGEMLRMPLDSVILLLKEILNEETTPALMSCIEPPDISTIERSYQSLHKANFISQPDDGGNITVLGAFVSAIGIDLTLGALIGLGIQFGVGPEAIELAAVLSFPKTPWILSNALVHKPRSFNAGSAKTYISRNIFDASIFSEPLGTMNLVYEFSRLQGSRLSTFAHKHGVHITRLRRLIATRNNLIRRVAEFVKVDPSLLRVGEPPSRMEHSKLTILRVIQVWVFHEALIRYRPLSLTGSSDGSMTVKLKTSGVEIKKSHLETLLRPERHTFRLRTNAEVEQNGGFNPVNDANICDIFQVLCEWQERLASYVIERDVDLSWIFSETSFVLLASQAFSVSPEFQSIQASLVEVGSEQSHIVMTENKGNRRGRGERACGRWKIQESISSGEVATKHILFRSESKEPGYGELINNSLRFILRKLPNLQRALSFDFCKNAKRKRKSANASPVVCQIFCCGEQAFRIKEVDFCDLLGLAKQDKQHWLFDKREIRNQSIVFEMSENMGDDNNSFPSTTRPLVRNAPEGLRLLSVLAASRRKHCNILIPVPSEEDELQADQEEDDEYISFSLDHGLPRMANRWVREDTQRQVFVFENSIPASVIPIEEDAAALFCCCANTLELRGGGLRVEGLTMLPPGGYFLLLSLLAFSISPAGVPSIPKDGEDLDEFIKDCKAWAIPLNGKDFEAKKTTNLIDWNDRIKQTIDFARSCAVLGERLICYPDKTRQLCEIFDGVDGYETKVWSQLPSNPFIPKSEAEMQNMAAMLAGLQRPGCYGDLVDPDVNESGRYEDADEEETSIELVIESAYKSTQETSEQSNHVQHLITALKIGSVQEEKKSKEEESVLEGFEVPHFSDQILSKFRMMLAPKIFPDSSVMQSTNMLSLCVKQFNDGALYEAFIQNEQKDEQLEFVGQFASLGLAREHFVVHQFFDHTGKSWYRATFMEIVLPLKERDPKYMPRWSKHLRPWTHDAAIACIPDRFKDSIVMLLAQVYDDTLGRRRALLFETIEAALQMEAAFVLERLFSTKEKHWHDHSYFTLMRRLSDRIPPSHEILQNMSFKQD